MNDKPNTVRPPAPGPSLEDQLRKAVEHSREQSLERQRADGVIATDAQGGVAAAHASILRQRRVGAMPELGMPYGGSFDAPAAKTLGGEQRPLPSAVYIANRLARSLDRLRAVESYAEAIAVTLAGPVPRNGASPAENPPPATSLFVLYERTLDEFDRIIDNIESEQARTRNILGE